MRTIRSLAICLIGCLALPAHSAEFTQLSDQPISFDDSYAGRCTHRMEGEIVAGDAGKLATMIANLPAQDHDDMNFILCMNSTGGRLEEGLKIGALLQDNFFGTHVPKGSICLSACAVAFMHGTIAAWEFFVNFRMLHPQALLGFHAPSLSISANADQMVPYALVDSAYQATMQTIADIVAGASKPVSEFASPIIPLSLLSTMLATEAEEFYYVETLHDAFRWDIDIFPQGLTAPQGFDIDVGLFQMCENAAYEITPDAFGEEIPRAITANDVEHGQVGYGWRVDMPSDHKLLSLMNIFNRQCSYKYLPDRDYFVLNRYVDGKLEREVYLPSVYLFAPETLLADIAPQ